MWAALWVGGGKYLDDVGLIIYKNITKVTKCEW